MEFSLDYPNIVKEHADQAFRVFNHNCAESVFEALLAGCGMECPAALRSVASGFGKGMGEAGCTCGALVGAVLASGLILNNAMAFQIAEEDCLLVSRKLHDAFRKKHGAACCRLLNRHLKYGSSEQLEICAIRTAETAELASRIIQNAVLQKDSFP